MTVETQGRTTPVRLIAVNTPETVAPDRPMGCYGEEAAARAGERSFTSPRPTQRAAP